MATKRSRLEAPESTSQVTSQAGWLREVKTAMACFVHMYTPKTNIAPENGWLE